MSNALERWFDNKKLNPFREISQMEDSFEKLFKEMMNSRNRSADLMNSFSPSCDISEDSANYTFKFDLPGVTKDQVKVEVNKDQLTVQAERRDEKSSESKKKYLSELFYGSYLRSFTLPGPVDEKKINAHFDNGVLTVTVPKTETLKGKQIPIQ